MAEPVDVAVSSVLNDAGLGLLLGTNLFRGQVRPSKINKTTGAVIVPVVAVFVLATGGPTARYPKGGADLEEPSAQVRYRGEPGKFLETQAEAERGRRVLQRATFPGYQSITARESAAQPLPSNDTEQPELTFNVDTMVEQL